jgi:CheY-like chemotaxis protein
MKIMIVDDNKSIREVIKTMIVEQRAEICECVDAISAIESCGSFRPDWVLMDIEMDGMDGIAAAKEISMTDSKAKIIIVTNYDEPQFRSAAKSAGAVAFVNKENLHELNGIISAEKGDDLL